MMAIGAMNIIGSLTSCYVSTGTIIQSCLTSSYQLLAPITVTLTRVVYDVGGFSRTAVNNMAGCKTAVSNIVMSMVVLLTLLLITPLFKYTPNAVLASIIIAAVLGLVNIEAIILLWKIDKFDFVACMGALFGVVFINVEIGLLIAVIEKSRQNSERCFSFLSYSIWTVHCYICLTFYAGGYIFFQNPFTSDKTKDSNIREASWNYCL